MLVLSLCLYIIPLYVAICGCDGFITSRHNQERDLTANLLREVATNVTVEPVLQWLTGEELGQSSNIEESERVNIRAHGFWNHA